jgi:predicted alpha/beta hydrolase
LGQDSRWPREVSGGEPAFAARSEKITFANATGEELAARLDWPDGRPDAFALIRALRAMDSFAAARVSRALAAHGIAALGFDFTGVGSSGGEFANTNFSSNLEDLAAAGDWLRRALKAPKVLIGHSLGGAAVLATAHRVPEAAPQAAPGGRHGAQASRSHREPAQGPDRLPSAARRNRRHRERRPDLRRREAPRELHLP